MKTPIVTEKTASSKFKRLKKLRLGRFTVISMPSLWLTIFFIIPFLVVFKISLAETAIAIPPYTALLEWDAEEAFAVLRLSLGNYLYLIEDAFYFDAYISSIKIAGISTIIALIIGFPMAYYIARSEGSKRVILLSLVILPFWTSFLLRVYAWVGILQKNGIINDVLLTLGVIDAPLQMLQTDMAVYIGIVYTYLPFMILPLYTALEKLDGSLLEASADLGGRPYQTFFYVTLPLCIPGIVAGCTLVFIPAVGEFVIPAMLGGSDTLMIGRVLWDEFFLNRDWPMASAVAVVMLIVLVLPVMFLRSSDDKKGDAE